MMDVYLKRAQDEIAAAAGHLTVEQLARSVGGKWSPALILEHLTLTFRLNVSALEKALAAGATKARKPSLYQWLSQVLVLDVGYFPRANAPEGVVPSGSIPPAEVRAAIAEALVLLDATLDRAAARFGAGTPLLRHAFFAAMTVPQWRKFHWRHARHHMRQVHRRTAG
jgi:hypothetical protein